MAKPQGRGIGPSWAGQGRRMPSREMTAIRASRSLVRRMRKGSHDAKTRRGRLVR